MRVFNLDISDRQKSSTTSKGNQIKWMKDNMYIKADTMGYESISEALMSELYNYIEGIDFVPYYLCKINEGDKTYFGCYSESYLKPDETTISVYRLFQFLYKDADRELNKYVGRDLVNFTLETVKNVTGIDYEQYLKNIIFIDYLGYNEDRHFNNICVVFNEKTGKYRPAPIFDNGLSLFSDLNDYPMYESILNCRRKVKSKPFATKFEKQVKYFDNSPLVIDFKSFEKKLSHSFVEFKEVEFNRAKSVLLRNMRGLEGKIWIQK